MILSTLAIPVELPPIYDNAIDEHSLALWCFRRFGDDNGTEWVEWRQCACDIFYSRGIQPNMHRWSWKTEDRVERIHFIRCLGAVMNASASFDARIDAMAWLLSICVRTKPYRRNGAYS